MPNMRIPFPSFTHVGKSDFLLLVTALSVHNVLSFSRQCQMCHNFQYFHSFGQHIKIFSKRLVYELLSLFAIDTDPDRSDPGPTK
jgi:hypothetical protein